MVDLELVSSEELLAELKKRYDIGVFYAYKDLSANLSESKYTYWGGLPAYACLKGLQVIMDLDAEQRVIRSWNEENDLDDDD